MIEEKKKEMTPLQLALFALMLGWSVIMFVLVWF